MRRLARGADDEDLHGRTIQPDGGPDRVVDLADAANAGEGTGNAGAVGQLVVTQSNGSPFPSMLEFGQMMTAKASFETDGGSADATDAQWTSAGPCTFFGTAGATFSVLASNVGSCQLTATANDMTATVAFTVSNVPAVTISGDASPILLGATRTYSVAPSSVAPAIPGVAVEWSAFDASVIGIAPSGNQAIVTGASVGTTMLVATVLGTVTASIPVTVYPAGLQLQATTGTNLLAGTSATVTVAPLSITNVPGTFEPTSGVAIVGAPGFSSVGQPYQLGLPGLVAFVLTGASAASPSVQATFGTLTSNALAFTIASAVSTVEVQGPQGTVAAGSGVNLTATIKDPSGVPIGGTAPAIWSDASGVFRFPGGDVLPTMPTATPVNLGIATIVASVQGVSSPVFRLEAVPKSIRLYPFGAIDTTHPGASPKVAVGATVTSIVPSFSTAALPGLPLAHVFVKSADPTKVSVDAGVFEDMDNGLLFTATGVAPAPEPGIALQAIWTDGVTTANDVTSAQVFLVVTGP